MRKCCAVRSDSGVHQVNKVLETIDLSDNSVDAVGAQHLAEAVEVHSRPLSVKGLLVRV